MERRLAWLTLLMLEKAKVFRNPPATTEECTIYRPGESRGSSKTRLVWEEFCQCNLYYKDFLKGKLLKEADALLVVEREAKIAEKEAAIKERAPPLKLSGLSVEELQELCKDLQRKIDTADDARYDIEVKVVKNEKEIQSLGQRILELKGHKRPNLKRVKRNGDVLGTLTEAKLSSKANFKANLKTVKKEEEKKEEVNDWRKNVEALSGMEGRKKKFNMHVH